MFRIDLARTCRRRGRAAWSCCAHMRTCTGGKLPAADCSVVWQMLVIIVLLVIAVGALIALRFFSRSQPTNA